VIRLDGRLEIGHDPGESRLPSRDPPQIDVVLAVGQPAQIDVFVEYSSDYGCPLGGLGEDDELHVPLPDELEDMLERRDLPGPRVVPDGQAYAGAPQLKYFAVVGPTGIGSPRGAIMGMAIVMNISRKMTRSWLITEMVDPFFSDVTSITSHVRRLEP